MSAYNGCIDASHIAPTICNYLSSMCSVLRNQHNPQHLLTLIELQFHIQAAVSTALVNMDYMIWYFNPYDYKLLTRMAYIQLYGYIFFSVLNIPSGPVIKRRKIENILIIVQVLLSNNRSEFANIQNYIIGDRLFLEFRFIFFFFHSNVF